MRESGEMSVFSRMFLGASIFLGAFLLFSLEPLMGKYLLPWFGGSSAVWTTAMFFFQFMLLAAYAYADLGSRFLNSRVQAALHAALLAAGVLFLSILPATSESLLPTDNPVLRLLAVLALSVGLPFFILATRAPLLQSWVARLGTKRSPYRLYALSNLASILGLVTYPIFVEPSLSLHAQARVWSVGFLIYAAATLGFMISKKIWRQKNALLLAAQEIPKEKIQPRRAALWVLLSFIPSTLFLGTTSVITQDIAPIPFLWVMPLLLYLLSFVLCFESPRWYNRARILPAYLLAMICLAPLLL